MIYDCTVTLLFVTICNNFVISSVRHTEKEKGHNIGYNKKDVQTN